MHGRGSRESISEDSKNNGHAGCRGKATNKVGVKFLTEVEINKRKLSVRENGWKTRRFFKDAYEYVRIGGAAVVKSTEHTHMVATV